MNQTYMTKEFKEMNSACVCSAPECVETYLDKVDSWHRQIDAVIMGILHVDFGNCNPVMTSLLTDIRNDMERYMFVERMGQPL